MTDQSLEADCSNLVAAQRAYFKDGNTRPMEWRIEHTPEREAMDKLL